MNIEDRFSDLYRVVKEEVSQVNEVNQVQQIQSQPQSKSPSAIDTETLRDMFLTVSVWNIENLNTYWSVKTTLGQIN